MQHQGRLRLDVCPTLGQANAMSQQQGRLGLVSTATLLEAQSLLSVQRLASSGLCLGKTWP